MLFISHIYTAFRLQKRLKIKNADTFYFATILPDIRYTTNLERKRTHIPVESLRKYFRTHSDHYKGYFLHLFIDEYMGQWQFHERLRAAYPKFLQPFLKSIFLNVILELYAWEHLQKKRPITLDNSFYEDYKKFGMKKLDVANYASYIQAMLDNFSIETASRVILSDPKLADNKKVAKYKQIGSVILNLPPLKWYLLSRVHQTYEAFVDDLQQQVLPAVLV